MYRPMWSAQSTLRCFKPFPFIAYKGGLWILWFCYLPPPPKRTEGCVPAEILNDNLLKFNLSISAKLLKPQVVRPILYRLLARQHNQKMYNDVKSVDQRQTGQVVRFWETEIRSTTPYVLICLLRSVLSFIFYPCIGGSWKLTDFCQDKNN